MNFARTSALCALTTLTAALGAAGCNGSSGRSPAPSAATAASATSGSTTSGATSGATSGSTSPGATPAPTTPTATGPTYRVSGWLPYWAYASGDRTLAANVGNGLDEVNLFGYKLNADGSLTACAGVEDAARQATIRNLGGELIPTVMDVHDSTVLDRVLASAAARQRAITAVVDLLGRFGYDGIDIDLEHAKTATRDAFSGFMEDMSAAVRARGKVFSLTIPGKRADRPSWVGYDYVRLAPTADRVKLMCYGYSGPWSAQPGPICPTTWIERVMDYAITTMPASKIQIGIPFYGYDWPANGGAVRSVTWATAQAKLARSAGGMRFDAALGETTFTYTDDAGVSHTVWFQDARAIAAKCDVARQYGAAGIAVWALGNESQTFWDEVRRVLK